MDHRGLLDPLPSASSGARTGEQDPAKTVRRWHGRLPAMVLEVALIDVVAGQEDEFATAYVKGHDVLAGTPGCRSVLMTRGIEMPNRFVLLVEWDSVEAHLQNFRDSERFTTWRGLIGPYFAEPPRVEHFVDVPV